VTTPDHVDRIRAKVSRPGGHCPPMEVQWLCDIAIAAFDYVEHLERFRHPGLLEARTAARVKWRELVNDDA